MNKKWSIRIVEEAAVIFESDQLSPEDRIVIEKWARTVNKHGPEGLLKDPDIWADHPLYGEWRGYRASSFSYRGRIIYKVKNNIVTVTVVRITADHDYKR